MNMNRFQGKIAVVTGGASGIGEAIMRQLISEGARVVIGDLNTGKGEALAAELGEQSLRFRRCDVGLQADVDALVDEAEHGFGGLDLLFNNAGIGGTFGTADQISAEDWLRVIAVNLNSVFYGCHAAIPAMRKRGGGAIVNTASISGLAGDYGTNAYNATKGAVINYTRTLAIDHARENIRVNALLPGLIDTPLVQVLDQIGIRKAWVDVIPMRRAGTPAEMAQVALFLASDAASFVTGSMYVADGGMSAHTGQPSPMEYLSK